MAYLSNMTGSPVYRVCIEGRISSRYARWFDGFALRVDDSTSPAQTLLEGVVVDDSALYGLISRLRDLNVRLLSVNRIEPSAQGHSPSTRGSSD